MSYDKFSRQRLPATIEIEKYTIDNYPTCLSWWGDEEHGREACIFLGSKSFGRTLVCMVTGNELYADYKQLPSISTPDSSCICWNFETEVKSLL